MPNILESVFTQEQIVALKELVISGVNALSTVQVNIQYLTLIRKLDPIITESNTGTATITWTAPSNSKLWLFIPDAEDIFVESTPNVFIIDTTASVTKTIRESDEIKGIHHYAVYLEAIGEFIEGASSSPEIIIK